MLASCRPPPFADDDQSFSSVMMHLEDFSTRVPAQSVCHSATESHGVMLHFEACTTEECLQHKRTQSVCCKTASSMMAAAIVLMLVVGLSSIMKADGSMAA